MKTRPTIHERFVTRFHLGDRPQPLSDADLDFVEAALNTKLPSAFRQFMTRFGPVQTPHILDEITRRNVNHPDVQDFLTVEEAIKGTKGYWSAGMPEDLIGIASDCMGNMIGFRRARKRYDDAPVVFFDHDFVVVSEIAPSFDSFLNWYLVHLAGS
jgi:SMI1 / KNR4 family (SUKH-1)